MSLTVTHISSSLSPKTYQIQPRSFTSHPKLTLQFHSLKSQHPWRSLLQASRRISNLDDPRNWGRSINSEFADDQNDDYDDDDEEEDGSLDLLVRFVSNVFKKISKRARKAIRSVLPVPISSKLVEFSVNGVLLLAFLWVLKALLEVTTSFNLRNRLLDVILGRGGQLARAAGAVARKSATLYFQRMQCALVARTGATFESNLNQARGFRILQCEAPNNLGPLLLNYVVCTLGSVVFVSILLIRGTWTGVTYLQERRNFKINELEDDHHVWTGTQPAG